MESFGNALNWIKDAAIRAADWVEDHPWWTLALLAGMTVAVIVL